MGTIVTSHTITLDGVVEDPTGDAGARHGGWFEQMTDTDREEWARVELAEAQQASALLLGRGSDAYFGARWNQRTGPWAETLNALPKYVVSSTVQRPVWANGTVLEGDVVTQVTRLKQEVEGEIVVYASRPLVHTLLEHGLVDEIRLIVFPTVLGEGERLFADLSSPLRLRRTDVRALGDGLALHTYRTAGHAPQGLGPSHRV